VTETSAARTEADAADVDATTSVDLADTTVLADSDADQADNDELVDEADDDGSDDEAGDDAERGSGKRAGQSDAELFAQSEIAADYIEGLLDILDMDGDIDELVSAGRPMVEVLGERLDNLVGPRGATLEALQELTRLAIFRQTGTPSRLLLDVGSYRANRRKELAGVARTAVEKAIASGEAVRLEPMSAFERKCVHDVVNASEGVRSESEGVEPSRRIVVHPA